LFVSITYGSVHSMQVEESEQASQLEIEQPFEIYTNLGIFFSYLNNFQNYNKCLYHTFYIDHYLCLSHKALHIQYKLKNLNKHHN